jgi:hypothetical protein
VGQPADDSKSKSPGRVSRRSSMDARKQTKEWVRRNYSNLLLYFGLIVGVFFFYHLMSDGDFSFLLTLGSIIRTFAFGILAWKVVIGKSIKGVSLKMLELYTIVFICRLSSILFYEGYLPFDKSGDYLYRGMEILSFLLCSTMCVLMVTIYKGEYKSELDHFGSFLGMPSFLGVVWVLAPAFGLSLIFHPSLNSNFVTDVAWTFALALESTAILPQVFMFVRFMKTEKQTLEPWTSHIVAGLGLARMIHLLFWLSSYTELNDKFNSSPGGAHVGHFVVFSQLLQLVLMCDYLYYYLKALYSGKDITTELSSTWAAPRKAEQFV